jgi:TIR domain-containing protein
MPQDVFLSYSRHDLGFVEELDTFLKSLDVSTWFDKRSLIPGKRWEDVIEDEIPRSTIFMTCLSKAGLGKHGYFHAEQALAEKAALRIPRDELYIIPVLLGDCEIPRTFKQYSATNLAEPGSIETLLLALSSALERAIVADSKAVLRLREQLLSHLGFEGASNQNFVDRFMQTDVLSFQDSMGVVERIANSSDTNRLAILLKLRSLEFLSYAEQAALDLAIDNVKRGHRTEELQATIRAAEWKRLEQMGVSDGDPDKNILLRHNKYVRYISRKKYRSISDGGSVYSEPPFPFLKS